MDKLLFSSPSYKDVLRSLIARERDKDPTITNKYLATRIPIQATYLSRFFNDEGSHLKDGTLFRLGKILNLSDEESDFLVLLKSHQTAEEPDRRDYLFRKIQDIHELKGEDQALGSLNKKLELESMYLLNPKCLLVQVALSIPQYKENPRLLCSPLKLDITALISILDLIEKNGFIERGEDPLDIKNVNAVKLHIESNELMRIHQYLLKTLIPPKLQETSEEEKKSFIVTFNMDEKSYQECVDRFDRFIGEVKEISTKSRNEGVYQLSFDLFKWC